MRVPRDGGIPRAPPPATGVEALAAAANSRPDAVLLDLVIPEPDGFEVLRRIRERDPRVPVIVMSALSQAEDVVRAMKLGATGLPAEAVRRLGAEPRAAPRPRGPRTASA